MSRTAGLDSSDYDRGACSVGIVHVGFGAFHRAHQAVYVDEYMQATGDLRWGIAAVNLRADDSEAFSKSAPANGGYVLKTVSSGGGIARRLVRPHVEFADWSKCAERAEELLARPDVHVVTLTVTESGYLLDKSGRLDTECPAIKAELNGGGRQTSVYAYLANGLRRRMRAGGPPISVLSCDNIRGNGRMLCENLKAYVAALDDEELSGWVESSASFPCSMVDRITPKPKPEDRQETLELFGFPGDETILAEDFIQWALEDDFAGERPELERVGVTVAPDVEPYEEAKIRILNGGHSSLTYLAALAGHATFDQAMADPALSEHFWNFETREVLPALTIPLPFDKASYQQRIAERFQNAHIGDTVERICMDGFSKIPVFIRPTLEGCFDLGFAPVHGIKSVAAWLVFARRTAVGAARTAYHEPNWAELEPLVRGDGFDRFVRSEKLWGGLADKHKEFGPLLAAAVEEVESTWPA